jgi:methionine sulfoxide reductase heme-binding subunit
METHRRWVESLVALIVPVYVAQATLGIGWGPLSEWQALPAWRLGSGLVLGTALGWLWMQSLIRSSGSARPRRWLTLHRLGGLVGVFALFAHTTRWGHGYLTCLAAVFLGTVLIGVASPSALRIQSPRYHRLWLFLHVVLALVLVAGVVFHVWIGPSYQ